MYQANEKRYETIPYHRCGDSGLLLPAVSLGFWHNFGDTASYDNMKSSALPPLTTALPILTWPITTDRSRAALKKSGADSPG